MGCPLRFALGLLSLVSIVTSARAQSTEEPFGYAVAGVGDLNGDGIPDIAVGAPGARPGGKAGAGRATVFSGKDGSVLLSFPGQSSNEGVGSSLAGLGDVNGDGKPDVAVGAPGFELPGMGWAGAVRVYSGTDGKLLWEVRGEWKHGKLGKSMAVVGDIDGDGIQDLLVGCPGVKAGANESAGLARVLSGKDGKALFTIEGVEEYEELGAIVSGAGDLNGDGRPDLVAGNPLAPKGRAQRAGVVRVHSGKDGTHLFTLRGEMVNTTLGSSIAPVGEINGDGTADLAVGAFFALHKVMAGGFVRICSGVDGSTLATWSEGKTPWDAFGLGVAASGDMNDDKVPDLWVAAMGGETVAAEMGKEKKASGRIDLVSGKDGSVIRTIRSTRFGEGLGMAMAVVGDINGDGIPDLLAGAAGAADGEAPGKAGHARVYSGKDGSVLISTSPPAEK